MEQSEELKELKDALEILEYHYSEYKEYKSKSKRGRAKDREYALSEMMAHAKFLQNCLSTPTIFPLIANGSPFQLESFWKFADSDMPEYLEKIKRRIEELEKQFPV